MVKPLSILILFGSSALYLVYKLHYITKLIRMGRPEDRFRPPGRRLVRMLNKSLLQQAHFTVRVPDYWFSGFLHILILAGFIVLLAGELEFLFFGLFPEAEIHVARQPFYKYHLLLQELSAGVIILTLLALAYRRLILRPSYLTNSPAAWTILGLIFLIVSSMVLINAHKLHAESAALHAVYRDLAAYMPIGRFAAWSVSLTENPFFAEGVWFVHLLCLSFFMPFIVNTKHTHILTAFPANYFRNAGPPLVALEPVDFEAEELRLGAERVEDLSWKQIFDGFACTECGRCVDRCPANQSGKCLNPKNIILSIRASILANGPLLLGAGPADAAPKPLFEEGFDAGEIWECTTCGACSHVCPVGNEHLRDIISFRRHEVMEEGRSPAILQKSLKNLEDRGHPFRGTAFSWLDWRKELEVPVFESGMEYLLWVGCAVVFEERTQAVARSMVRILNRFGISYGVLPEHRCTGDPAKQAGNEFLFQEMALSNIELLESLGVQKILTLCPHCYHSLRHFYPELGGDYEVVPHPEFLAWLAESDIGRGRLADSHQTIVYHDPCYFARHNNYHARPRALLERMGRIREASRHGSNTLCCGGGGGHYWAEEQGTRMNQVRAGNLVEAKGDSIVTSCPFCLLMLTDGLKAVTEDYRLYDIAEVFSTHLEI
jgi:Fe-S oxidoreductase